MKCPYCDDNIHPMAKFCPKCGLPLKEDQTVQGQYGSYLVDDSGPSPWVIVGGALGIVVIAVGIGWMTGQGRNRPDTTVQRQPLPTGARSAPAWAGVPQYSQTAWGGYGSSKPSVDWRPNVRWAYNPSHTATQPQFNQQQVMPAPEPVQLPPPNMGVLDVVTRQIDHPVLMASAAPVITTPLMPELPPAPVMPEVSTTVAAPAVPAAAPAWNLEEGAPPMAGREDPRSSWVYDPVHEQWVIRGDRVPSRLSSPVRPRTPTFDNSAIPQRAFAGQ